MPETLNSDERKTIAEYDRNAEFYQVKEPHLNDISASPAMSAFCRLVPENANFLDVGCGHGRMVPAFKNVGITRYIGIDPSRKNIELARKVYPDTDFRVVSVYDLKKSFAASYFDGFFAVTTLAHIPQHKMPKALASIREVVKGGGIGCITMPQFLGTVRLSRYVPISAEHSGPYTTMYGWSYSDLCPLLREARFEWYEPEYEGGMMILGVVAA